MRNFIHLMNLRNNIVIVLSVLLAGCGSGETERQLVVDMNGTALGKAYIYAIDNQEVAVDSVSPDDGRYIVTTDNYPYSFYRMRFDERNYLDMILGTGRDCMINARMNHLMEATTNDWETEMLWKIERLQSAFEERLATDSLYKTSSITAANRKEARKRVLELVKELRSESDLLRSGMDSTIAIVPFLNLGTEGFKAYNIMTDHYMFEKSAKLLSRVWPDDERTRASVKLVEETRYISTFMNLYAKQRRGPDFRLSVKSGGNVDNSTFEGQKYILFFASDTTNQSAKLWTAVAQHRFEGYKIVASVPEDFQTIHNLNVYSGHFRKGDEQHFKDNQPVVMFIDENGRVERIYAKCNVNEFYDD